MFLRTILYSILTLLLCVGGSNAQVMQIYVDDEINSFEVADIDSITFTPVEEEPPSIVVAPNALNFGQVVINRQRELSLIIRNVGVGMLIIEAVELEEGAFTVAFENPIEILAGDTLAMTVTFSPTDVSDYSTDLMIRSNDMDHEEILISLIGTGYIPEGQAHFIYEITDTNMSILVTAATIDGEPLVENDEIGVFTTNGLCAGASPVPAGFPNNAMGIAAWGAEQNQENGFVADEPLSFRFWDLDAQQEFVAEAEVLNGVELIYASNGFIVVSLSAGQ